jgi:hypothetical protein
VSANVTQALRLYSFGGYCGVFAARGKKVKSKWGVAPDERISFGASLYPASEPLSPEELVLSDKQLDVPMYRSRVLLS